MTTARDLGDLGRATVALRDAIHRGERTGPRLVVATTPREMMEMRYLWQRPVRLGNARLVAALGAEPHTPLERAVRTTLASLGCL